MIFSRFPKLKKYSLESDTTKERKKEKQQGEREGGDAAGGSQRTICSSLY